MSNLEETDLEKVIWCMQFRRRVKDRLGMLASEKGDSCVEE